MIRWKQSSLGEVSVVDQIKALPEPAKSRFAKFFDSGMPGVVTIVSDQKRDFNLAARSLDSSAANKAIVTADLLYDGSQASQAEIDSVVASTKKWADENGIDVAYRGPGTLTLDLSAPTAATKTSSASDSNGLGLLLGIGAALGIGLIVLR